MESVSRRSWGPHQFRRGFWLRLDCGRSRHNPRFSGFEVTSFEVHRDGKRTDTRKTAAIPAKGSRREDAFKSIFIRSELPVHLNSCLGGEQQRLERAHMIRASLAIAYDYKVDWLLRGFQRAQRTAGIAREIVHSTAGSLNRSVAHNVNVSRAGK